ncbi:hypothetical protein F511_03304 [Dorcoceras hygrometricum]|uniref:Small ribosomal subunit protein bS18c n=1 Tax=Dorcoceras hygrometricum TaxID=472368 RepID=A0A2Z7BLR5_9LAMI|nr:hypothetical protein F511_03304 [Dorcoceras hygrometricum]
MLSCSADIDDNYNFGSSEAVDFEQQLIGGKNGPRMNSFYQKLDKVEKAYGPYGVGSNFNVGVRPSLLDGLNDGFSTLNDGMDNKLKQAATYFEFDPVEVNQENYAFRPDVNLVSGTTYDTKDLDLRKPGVRRPGKWNQFETTTEEVLRKADFRNVRFLANFLTEAGIIIKRSKTGISAKAQRKIAREIKTARAFGLMPFTTMGTKQFTYGRTMEDEDVDFGYEIYEHDFVDNDSQET